VKNHSNELFFAVELAKSAGSIAMAHLRQGVSETIKPDGTPVTVADKECEQLIRKRIKDMYPADSILGEEEGESGSSNASRRWIIDPIDGTYNYVRHMPIFATLIALEQDGEVVLGVVHAPAMQETFWAERAQGAYKNGLPIKVSPVDTLAQAQINFGGPRRILEMGWWDGLTELVSKTVRQRGFGDYLSFSTVFEGKAEATIEVGVKIWDLAPMKILAEEAGGKFSDLKGGASIKDGSCLVSNGKVHEEVLNILLSRKSKAPAQ
jgi:histidinol-phosphatase